MTIHHTDKVKAHFERRAPGFEDYSDWCKNRDFFDLCTRPFRDKQNLTCLDLGGGSGWLPRRDQQISNRRWYILDISYAMSVHSRGILPFVVGDSHNVPFTDKCFDVVMIRSLLHYVDVATVLHEVARILRPHGQLIVAQKVRLRHELDSDWHNKFFAIRGGHASSIFTETSLLRLFSESGYVSLGATLFREKRSVDYRRWLSRDGTIQEQLQEDMHNMILSIPQKEREELSLSLVGHRLEYDRNWLVGCLKAKE